MTPIATNTQNLPHMGAGLVESDQIEPSRSVPNQSDQGIDQEIDQASALVNAAFNLEVQYLIIACLGDRTDRLVDTSKHNPWDETIHNRLVLMAIRTLNRLVEDAIRARKERNLSMYAAGVNDELLPQFVVNVVTPMGLGWELAVADAAIQVKKEMQDQRLLHLTCMIPFPGHHRHWPEWAKAKVESILNMQVGVPVTVNHVTNAAVDTPQLAQNAVEGVKLNIMRQLEEETRYGNQALVLSLHDTAKYVQFVPHSSFYPIQNLWGNWTKHSGLV